MNPEETPEMRSLSRAEREDMERQAREAERRQPIATRYVCQACGKEWDTRAQLNGHRSSHLAAKRRGERLAREKREARPPTRARLPDGLEHEVSAATLRVLFVLTFMSGFDGDRLVMISELACEIGLDFGRVAEHARLLEGSGAVTLERFPDGDIGVHPCWDIAPGFVGDIVSAYFAPRPPKVVWHLRGGLYRIVGEPEPVADVRSLREEEDR